MENVKKLASFFSDLIQTIVFSISIFLFIYLLLFQPHKIKGDSMQPNFPDGEFLLTDKISYRFHPPQRGDVIVFKAPVNEEDDYIKRIIGLPGDTVSIKDGFVYINGQKLEETYLPAGLYTNGGIFLPNNKEVVVPDNYFFVMGDNRSYSSDSRAWGFVSKKNIIGKAWLVYWPPQKAGIVPKVNYNL
ncbi:MAG: signal peptidase I [Patescibacteria group bacterium]|nr:MAG: signal peptidase I [Patescibacteria group bacterium]